jgi:O-antigen/teichoic acid export membrane protein
MIILNAAAQLAALAAIILIQMAYSIAAARLLGVEDFGRFSFVFSITQILLIGCDLGLHNTAVRKIALAFAEDRRSDAEKAFSTFFSLKVLLSLAIVGCAAFFSAIFPGLTGIRLALLLFSGGMFFQSLNTALNVAFQACGKLYLGSLNSLLTAVLNLGIGGTLMLLGGRVAALGLANLLAMSVAFLINYKIFTNYVHRPRFAGFSHWRELVWESLPVGLGTLFNTIAARIDMTLLLLLAGSYQTGIYSAAYRIYGTLLNVPIAIFSAVLPAMASFGKEREGVRRLFNRSIVLMIATALPLALAFYGFSGVLITLLYGKTYAASADVLRILAWSLIPAFAGMAFSHVILSQASLSRRLPAIATAGMIANVGLNLLLVPRIGNRGAAVTTLLTEALLASLYALGAGYFLFGKDEMKKGGRVDTLTRRAFGAPPSPRGRGM